MSSSRYRCGRQQMSSGGRRDDDGIRISEQLDLRAVVSLQHSTYTQDSHAVPFNKGK